MTRALPTALLLGLLLASARAAEDDDKLQGSWKVISIEKNGKKQPEDATKAMKFVIKGDKFVLKVGDQDNESSFKLDAGKKPKSITLAIKTGDKEEVIKGIYQLDGDDLKICAAGEPGVERPTEFATKPKSGVGLLILKREKP